MFNFILHNIVLSVPVVNSTKFIVLFLFSFENFLLKKKGRDSQCFIRWLKMLLVSFACTIKSGFNLSNAMLCFASVHFLTKKRSVDPYYPQNSSSRHRRPSIMLTQSAFLMFGCVPSRLNYSIFPVHASALSSFYICSSYSLSLQCPHLY